VFPHVKLDAYQVALRRPGEEAFSSDPCRTSWMGPWESAKKVAPPKELEKMKRVRLMVATLGIALAGLFFAAPASACPNCEKHKAKCECAKKGEKCACGDKCACDKKKEGAKK
jgi:hypothetical protein